MTEMIEIEQRVPYELGETRLDQAAAKLIPEHSRSRIQGWIKSGELLVNGNQCKPRDKVAVGDEIVVKAVLESQERWEPQSIDLEIVFEDEHLLVLNKPAGLVVHPAAGHADGTLVNALLHHCPSLDTIPRAGIVHRLDKDTTGLMVVAKSLTAHTSLVDQLQTRTMGREYEAITNGVMTGGGMVDEPIDRHPKDRKRMAVSPFGKPAVTHYRVLHRFPSFTHIRLKLETGRTHQIRVHMAHIHYPLIGDPVYGGRFRLPKGASPELIKTLKGFSRQALHAKRLELFHPETGAQLEWEIDLPQDFEALLHNLGEYDIADDEE